MFYDGEDISGKIFEFKLVSDFFSFHKTLYLYSTQEIHGLAEFETINREPLIELKIKDSGIWTSVGTFIICGLRQQNTLHADVYILTCKSLSAKLGAPFGYTVSRTLDADTGYFEILEEMCGLADVTWDETIQEIPDYEILAGNYSIENLNPLQVILDLALRAGCYVTCNFAGKLVIKPLNYDPTVAVVTYTDPDIIKLVSEIRYIHFGNRINVTDLEPAPTEVTDEVLGTGAAGVTEFHLFTDHTPLVRETIEIVSPQGAGTITITDDGHGRLYCENEAEGWVDYASGPSI